MKEHDSVKIAREIARVCHRGQTDQGGNPCILHPEAVAGMLETDEEKTAGWLHDVLEDTDFSREVLGLIFGERILSALDCVTRRPGEAWEDYIDRVSSDPLAIRVKIADLTHNMDLSRITNREIEDWDRKRAERYRRTRELLAGRLPDFQKD